MVWRKGKLRNTMWVLKLWLENCMGGKPWLSHEPILEHTEHHWAIFIDISSSNESWRRRSIGLGGQYLLCILMCSEHSWHVYEMIWNAYNMHSWCKISIDFHRFLATHRALRTKLPDFQLFWTPFWTPRLVPKIPQVVLVTTLYLVPKEFSAKWWSADTCSTDWLLQDAATSRPRWVASTNRDVR